MRHDPSSRPQRMPPIITIDTSPCQTNVDAHHSTHRFTTLLNNDQLVLVEVQGTLEYNVATNDVQTIRLGEISWDEKVIPFAKPKF